jgi:hypothetical protein
MMLQINNTDQVSTPRNTGCPSIIAGSFSLLVKRFAVVSTRDWAQDLFDWREQLIAEEDEPHRLKGEPLSPRFSLESRSKHKERIGEYLWAAQSQQKPVPRVANPLKRYKWRYWQHPDMNLPPVSVQNDNGEQFEIAAEELSSQFNGQIQSWDLSFEGEARSDYVVDRVHEKVDFTQTIRAIQAFRSRHPKPAAFGSRTGPTEQRRSLDSLASVSGHLQGKPVQVEVRLGVCLERRAECHQLASTAPTTGFWVEAFLFELCSSRRASMMILWTPGRRPGRCWAAAPIIVCLPLHYEWHPYRSFRLACANWDY